jgi:Flp pilus assembly protein TadD
VSLIYFALNRLENKSDKSNSMHGDRPSEHISANEYFLPSEKTGMPLWLIVLLVLSCVGMLAGWMLTRQIKDIEGRGQEISHSQKVSGEKIITPLTISDLLPQQKTELELLESHPMQSQNSELPMNLNQLNEEKNLLALKKEMTRSNSNKSPEEAENTPQEIAKDIKPVKQEIASLIEIKVESNKVNVKQNNKKNTSKLAEVNKKTDEEINTQEINRLIYAIKAAVKGGKNVEADVSLAKLQLLLEPESMTLLHLQAWRQMNGGDQELSRSIYQQIISRNPEDEIAAINLAVMLWKSGNHNEAKRVIEAIAEKRPDSEVVQNYRRQFGERK